MITPFTARDLMQQCYRGDIDGMVGALWTDHAKQSYWFSVEDVRGPKMATSKIPNGYLRGNIYFAVNPLSQVPSESKRGNTDPRYIRSQIAFVCCVNVIYCEFDGKDYVNADEYRCYLPANFRELSKQEQGDAVKAAKETEFYQDVGKYKKRAMRAVQDMVLTPTLIIDSGGGYHTYLFLAHTVYVEDENREDIREVQRGWVRMNGGDHGVSDITRIFRLPGFYNMKSGFGDNKPLVSVVHYDPTLLYEYADIEAAVGDWIQAQGATDEDSGQSCNRAGFDGAQMGDVRRLWNENYNIKDIFTHFKYSLVSEDKKRGIIRMARPGKKEASITIFPAENEHPKRPQIAVHHSTNDDLHQVKTNRNKAGLDAFACYAYLVHGGKFVRAYVEAKKLFGLWVVREDDGI